MGLGGFGDDRGHQARHRLGEGGLEAEPLPETGGPDPGRQPPREGVAKHPPPLVADALEKDLGRPHAPSLPWDASREAVV